jgi:hypothetical protein
MTAPMLTLCPGLSCPLAPDCERNVRHRRRHEYPHAPVYPVDKQPGGINTVVAEVGGVKQMPVREWRCDEFRKKEMPT